MPKIPRGLVYVTDDAPGIRRVRRSSAKAAAVKFDYLTAAGRKLKQPAAVKRIAALAIPPAYENVWICANPRGHLQATGRDARGRKQYRYHADWSEHRNGRKHSRMRAFGAALPRLRRALRRDLRQQGLPRAKVLALVVSLLDATQLRVGNTEYARSNGSFGLTTLRDRHATFKGKRRVILQFRGKGGTDQDVSISNARLASLVRKCQQLPGQQLFQYLDDKGKRHGIDSGQVNAYLKEHMGDDFTAKDFRTWHATLHAARLLTALPLPDKGGEPARRRCINAVVKEVASGLRNTPAVCRKSYINPQVFTAWQAGKLDAAHHRPGAAALITLLRQTAA